MFRKHSLVSVFFIRFINSFTHYMHMYVCCHIKIRYCHYVIFWPLATNCFNAFFQVLLTIVCKTWKIYIHIYAWETGKIYFLIYFLLKKIMVSKLCKIFFIFNYIFILLYKMCIIFENLVSIFSHIEKSLYCCKISIEFSKCTRN